MSDQLPRSEADLRDLADFYADHDVSEEIGSGDVVTPEPMVTTSLRLPSDIVERLRAEAAARGIRYTSLIRDVLLAYLEEAEPSSRTLEARLDDVERDHDRRLRRLEDAQRQTAQMASDRAGDYAVAPENDDVASRLLTRIAIDANVCAGKPRIRDTRIWVGLILGMLAHGKSVDMLLDEYPQLDDADISACLAYGAMLANERSADQPVDRSSG